MAYLPPQARRSGSAQRLGAARNQRIQQQVPPEPMPAQQYGATAQQQRIPIQPQSRQVASNGAAPSMQGRSANAPHTAAAYAAQNAPTRNLYNPLVTSSGPGGFKEDPYATPSAIQHYGPQSGHGHWQQGRFGMKVWVSDSQDPNNNTKWMMLPDGTMRQVEAGQAATRLDAQGNPLPTQQPTAAGPAQGVVSEQPVVQGQDSGGLQVESSRSGLTDASSGQTAPKQGGSNYSPKNPYAGSQNEADKIRADDYEKTYGYGSGGYQQSVANAKKYGYSEEYAKAAWDKGYYIAGDGDFEILPDPSERHSAGFGAIKESADVYSDLEGAGLSAAKNSNIRDPNGMGVMQETFNNIKTTAATAAEDAYNQKQAGINNELRRELDSMQAPELDPVKMEDMLRALRQSSALEQAQALRANLERGAKWGVDPQALMGANARTTQEFATQRAQQEAQVRMQQELQNFQAKSQHMQNKYNTAMAMWSQATSAADKAYYYKLAQDAQREMMVYNGYIDELNRQIGPSDILGMIGGTGSSALSAYIGAAFAPKPVKKGEDGET